jgi:EAL domain-containing protein (putative c-di-GMP-specific phosphodiesterase class I)
MDNDLRNKAPGSAVVGINLSGMQTLTAAYGFHYTQDLVKNIANTLNMYSAKNRLLFKTHENRFVFYIKDYEGRNELIAFCDTIAKALKDMLTIERIGGGIGVLEITRDCTLNADQLLKNLLVASEVAIESKDEEFGVCFYDSEIEMKINREQVIKHDLDRIALYENDGGLYLEYQPILSLRTDRICGFEALARLKSDKLGLVAPSEFIPIAEKTKLIIPIGRKVIRQALRFLNKLKENRCDDTYVSVNVSIVQLLYKGFSDELLGMIDESRVSPHNVVLEITESMFASNCQEINNVLTVLKGEGIRISIDDFGTGYSSLAREHKLYVNCIKIDKHFIDSLLPTNSNRAITEEIISIARKFDHCTVAEGVEHEIQKQYLINCGCEKIQGYLVSKPLDEDAAIAMLKKYEGQSHRQLSERANK